MKKLVSTVILTLALVGAYAQGKIMVGASARLFGPACTNCTALYGGSVSGAYAIIDKVALGLDLGVYSRSQNSNLNTVAVGLTADFYPKGDFKGFFVGPDITFISIAQKFNGVETFSDKTVTIGANLGWAIAIGDRLRIIPHLGFGTWYENSKGRITTGVKVGFRI